MSNETIEQLKKFQSALAVCIQDRFKGKLTQEQINILTNSNYIDQNELSQLKSGIEIQGLILRKMLRSILNIECEKVLQVDQEYKSIKYGKLLEDLIIENFANDISNKYKFQINIDSNLQSKLSVINELKNILSDTFDTLVLNKNAKDLLSLDNLKPIEAVFDVNAIDEYKKTTLQQMPTSNKETISPNTTMTTNSINTQVSNYNQLNEKYEELVMKYARGETLSDDELKVLLKSTPDLMDETQIEEFTNKNSGPTLERTDSSAGFSYIKMTLYLIVITNILGFIIAYLLTR